MIKSVTSQALDPLPLSQTDTPSWTPYPLERDVLYGRPLIHIRIKVHFTDVSQQPLRGWADYGVEVLCSTVGSRRKHLVRRLAHGGLIGISLISKRRTRISLIY